MTKTTLRAISQLAAVPASTVTTPAQQPPVQAADKVSYAGRLIDGASTTARERVSMLIGGNSVLDRR